MHVFLGRPAGCGEILPERVGQGEAIKESKEQGLQMFKMPCLAALTTFGGLTNNTTSWAMLLLGFRGRVGGNTRKQKEASMVHTWCGFPLNELRDWLARAVHSSTSHRLPQHPRQARYPGLSFGKTSHCPRCSWSSGLSALCRCDSRLW